MAKQCLMLWRMNFNTEWEIGAWRSVFRRGFPQRIDQRETLMLVCLSARMEVVGKSCRQQGVPTTAMASVRLRDNCNATEV